MAAQETLRQACLAAAASTSPDSLIYSIFHQELEPPTWKKVAAAAGVTSAPSIATRNASFGVRDTVAHLKTAKRWTELIGKLRALHDDAKAQGRPLEEWFTQQWALATYKQSEKGDHSADGLLRYFVLPDTRMGSMAERTVIDRRRSIVLPESTNPTMIAGAMNPAMSSWIALRQRVSFQAGQSVLILGAGGNAGRMAVQVAKRLGAKSIIAAGRDEGRLSPLLSTDAGSAGDNVSLNTLGLSAEVPLVIAPVPHVAFTLAPTIDYGVTGSAKLTPQNGTSTSVDVNPLELGLQAGMVAWF